MRKVLTTVPACLLLIIGTVTTGITLVALVGLRPLRSLVRRYAVGRDEFLIQGPSDLDVEAVVAKARERKATLGDIRITEESGERTIQVSVQLPRDLRPTDFAADLASIERVRDVDWVR